MQTVLIIKYNSTVNIIRHLQFNEIFHVQPSPFVCICTRVDTYALRSYRRKGCHFFQMSRRTSWPWRRPLKKTGAPGALAGQALKPCSISPVSLERCCQSLGTNWGTGSSVWRWGRTSSLWGWRSPGPGCPGRLWSLLLLRYSRPAWTRSCAACCRWPCFSRGGWTRWPTEFPSNPYYSVILRFARSNAEEPRSTLCFPGRG